MPLYTQLVLSNTSGPCVTLRSDGDLDQSLFLQTGKERHDIPFAFGPRYFKFRDKLVAQFGGGMRLFEGIPDLDAGTLQAEIQRTFEIENCDLIVDLTRHLSRDFPENRRHFDHEGISFLSPVPLL